MPTAQPTVKDAVLMANVSRRYFVHDQSKSEIADVLGISRFRVARLIARARDTGIVRIEIGLPGLRDNELAAELGARFGLDHVVILDVPEDQGRELLRKLGVAAIELLGEILTADDVLGLASARPLLGIGDQVGAFPACPVVQLTGAISRPDALDIIQCVRDITRAGGGEAYVFYAPILGAATVEAVRQNPDVARAVAMIPKLTAIVLGVGAWAPGLSTLYDVLPEADRQEAARQGVAAEIAGIYLDADGNPLRPDVADRTLAPSFEELAGVGVRIGIAFGRGKAVATRAGLASGLLNGLITHRAAAEELLSLP
ncbi:sugar-binding transcriptional regulator [Microlunatus sp. GCM10028923]|uniref:sugar-binding transcriptional regulator n=1 Tax=Microlunatus sp. GCM10028923 TaxID=3273400 RepID=UPI0036170E99